MTFLIGEGTPTVDDVDVGVGVGVDVVVDVDPHVHDQSYPTSLDIQLVAYRNNLYQSSESHEIE